jgi:hypothetical protein
MVDYTESEQGQHDLECAREAAHEEEEAARRWGVWCLDANCFYDPTPRDWDNAVTETAALCQTMVQHQFEVRELPPVDEKIGA